MIPELCQEYDFPLGASGAGTIGLIELGGGYNPSDLTIAFQMMQLPAPNIIDVSVDGTKNSPGGPADMEVALDLQVIGGSFAYCTGKPANIKIFWTQDIAAGVAAAAGAGCATCSISWGDNEEAWGPVALQAMNTAARSAGEAGMATFAAAGDNDADDGNSAPSVDGPACCPNVIACGGTSKPKIGIETVWNNNPGSASGEGTGGGYSSVFAWQSWQLGAARGPKGLGRMVPDVAACADPETGYQIWLNNQLQIIGGTSAVAPLYAGLVASLSAKPGLLGAKFFKNPSWFNDITSGGNGTYSARIGPDPCTGLGSPIGNLFKL